MINNMEYDKKFYKSLKNNFSSAEVVVPIVLQTISPVIDLNDFRVVDFGCGTGNWLKIYKSHGAQKVLGINEGG